MPIHKITHFFSNSGTRNTVRMRVVNKFSEEKHGSGKQNLAEKYIYYVETLKDGNRIYLKRPANLHYGFDFLVCVENTNYAAPKERKRNYPRHNEFQQDLLKKKKENPFMYKKLYDCIKKIYECNNITEKEISKLTFQTGYPVDHILKVLKWLFIEQDIRYWNYSGRNMTWSIIPDRE